MFTFPMPKLIFVAVLSGLILVSEQCQDCPEGWEVFDDRCYKFFDFTTCWSKAQAYCETQGGNLTSVHSTDEYNFLKEVVKASGSQENPFWIGLTDNEQEGTWTWSDGSTMDFQHWNEEEPNSAGEEDCVISNWLAAKGWNDLACYFEHGFICAAKS